MTPNAFAIFRVNRSGSLEMHSKKVYSSQEAAEANIHIPADSLGEIVYVVLPVCTNKKGENGV